MGFRINTNVNSLNAQVQANNTSKALGASLEKVVLDAEFAGIMKRYLKPMDFTDETMAVEEIKKAGPGGNFVSSPHTFKHFRTEFSIPEIFTRDTYDKWDKGEKLDAKQRANRKVNELIENYERPAMDKGLEKELNDHVNRSYPVLWTDDPVEPGV